MNTKRQNRVMLVILSLTCVLAVAASLFATGLKGFVKADDQTLYTQDFESLSTDANSTDVDDIYLNTGWAGGVSRSIVQSTGTYIKAPYQFWDNGCQQSAVYTNTSRIIPSTTEGKDYTLTMRVKPYGDFVDLSIAVLGPDTSKNNSIIILKSGVADGIFTNYIENSNFISGTAVSDNDGWYDINATVKGTGGYVHFVFYMNVDKTRYEAINAADATGFCLETLKFADGENVVYELKLTPGLVGESELFPACGLAGFASTAGTYKEGINGKTLRTVYGFFAPGEDGTAWQLEGLYINTNIQNVPLEQDKTYYVQFTVRPFGNVKTTVCRFMPGDNIDSQVILNADKTYSTGEYGGVKIFDSVEVKVNGDEFTVSAAIKGAGAPFKIFFNMLSSDAAKANENKDTGVYFDDVSIKTEKTPEVDITEGEYKTALSRDFNSDSLDVSGSDAMYQTNGFAGVVGGQLTIKENGFNGTRCLSAMYVYNDDGWQKSNLYLDSGKLGNTVDGQIYRWNMQIKATGSVDYVYIGFQSEKPTVVTDYVSLHNGGAFAEPSASGSRLIKCVLNSYNDGVYDVSIYMQGNGGYTFNFFNAHSTAPASANENLDSGILLDNYSISVKKEPDPAGFNVTERFYNINGGANLTVNSTFADVAEVTVDGEVLSADNYSFEDGLFTFNAAYLAELSHGTHTIIAKNATGEESTLTINVDDIPVGEVYSNDFSAMPELNGGQEANDKFFQNSWFDPAGYGVYTEGTDETRVIKFVPKNVDEGLVGLFQTNPNEGRLHYLTKDKFHTLSMDLKPLGAKVITLKGFAHSNSGDVSLFALEIDLSNGKQLSGDQNANLCYDVTAKEDGWYRLSVSFKFTEDDGVNSYAFVQFFAPAATMDSAWYLDNFTAESEIFAELVSTEARYDKASATRPYAIVNLKGFEISSVKAGDTVLEKDTDYTVTVTPNGSYRIDLTESFCANYALGNEEVITVITTKNQITFNFTVVDTAPVMEDEATYDLAYGKDFEIAADLKGYEISLVDVDGVELGGSEYMYNADGKFVLKYNYLKGLSVGEHVFVIRTTSGAKKTLTLTIEDSTPVFEGGAVYDKTQNADYTVKINLFGKEITEVKFDGTALDGEEYSYANGTLTINAAVLQAKNAGKYVLSVKTVAERTLEIEIKDVPPVIDGEYEVVKGSALVLNVNLSGKEIISIMVGEIELTAADYSYADGKLTVNAEVLSELASGEQVLTLTTAGGTVQKAFTLKDGTPAIDEPDDDAENLLEDCQSSISGSFVLTVFAAVAVAYICRKRKEQN